jgi:E3 ubiquitin-protein ligase HUWE1
VTGASSYHGFLPTLVRNCIANLTGTAKSTPPTPSTADPPAVDDNLFPLQLATALFSFLYHLASYEPGAESFVSNIDVSNIDEAMDTGSQYGDDEMTTSTQSLGAASSSSNKIADTLIVTNRTCLPQRAALLKSMLNFLKKAIQDIAFSDSIRHIMEATLPESLKHIISNSEYYGPSLFLLATDVVTVYVFQEPLLLSSLQDNGLTDVVLQALLKKDVPATREVLGSLPNVFSALCLNTRGLESFVKYNPFEKLFRVLISPVYLSAMRRRRSSDPMGDTASNIGNAMDELMRNQPSLKTPAIKAIIKLLEEIVELGTNPKYICWRAQNKNDVSP